MHINGDRAHQSYENEWSTGQMVKHDIILHVAN